DEGFRVPAGVRKPPMQEPASHRRRLMEISDFGWCRRWRDGCLKAPGWMRTDGFVACLHGIAGMMVG
ncbi:hypothetical protein, partial [Aminobacter sp. AP02]|uniref:hypothetical protein n=1 Tax=Aminobacter sp. AP02 TaxID=2135737 RepID=UPI001AECE3BA